MLCHDFATAVKYLDPCLPMDSGGDDKVRPSRTVRFGCRGTLFAQTSNHQSSHRQSSLHQLPKITPFPVREKGGTVPAKFSV